MLYEPNSAVGFTFMIAIKLFSSIVKAHFLSGAEPSEMALEVFDDHSHLLANGYLDDKMKSTKMTPRDIAPRDEDEENISQ